MIAALYACKSTEQTRMSESPDAHEPLPPYPEELIESLSDLLAQMLVNAYRETYGLPSTPQRGKP